MSFVLNSLSPTAKKLSQDRHAATRLVFDKDKKNKVLIVKPPPKAADILEKSRIEEIIRRETAAGPSGVGNPARSTRDQRLAAAGMISPSRKTERQQQQPRFPPVLDAVPQSSSAAADNKKTNLVPSTGPPPPPTTTGDPNVPSGSRLPNPRSFVSQLQYNSTVLKQNTVSKTFPRETQNRGLPVTLPESLVIEVRGIRFGTFRTTATQPLQITPDSMKFNVRAEDSAGLRRAHLHDNRDHNYQFTISAKHLLKIQHHIGKQMAVMFMTVTEYCAKKIGEAMVIPWNNDGRYRDSERAFDPRSDQPHHKYITVLLADMNDNNKGLLLESFFSHRVEPRRIEYAEEINEPPPTAPLCEKIEYLRANKMLSESVLPSESGLRNNAAPSRKKTAPAKPQRKSQGTSPIQGRPAISRTRTVPTTSHLAGMNTSPLIFTLPHRQNSAPGAPAPRLAAQVNRVTHAPSKALPVTYTTATYTRTPTGQLVQSSTSGLIVHSGATVRKVGQVLTVSANSLGRIPAGNTATTTAVPRTAGGHILSYSPVVTIKGPGLRRTPANAPGYYSRQLAGKNNLPPPPPQPPTIIDVTEDDGSPSGSGESKRKLAENLLATDGATEAESPARKQRKIESKPKDEDIMFCYPPAPEKGRIVVHFSDKKCLEEGELLNDTIVDFYLRYLVHDKVSELLRSKVHIFNPFFWVKLNQKISAQAIQAVKTQSRGWTPSDLELRSLVRHQHVKQWTKNVDLFEKDFILFPINEAYHWMMIMVCFPGKVETNYDPSYFVKKEEWENAMGRGRKEPKKEPDEATDGTDGSDGAEKETEHHQIRYERHPCIILFDSLSVNPKERYQSVKLIREYLRVEWEQRKPRQPRKSFDFKTIKGSYPRLPQQENWWDCGVFLLQYAEKFLLDTPPVLPPEQNADWVDWFSQKDVDNKREEIKNLIDTIALENGFDFQTELEEIGVTMETNMQGCGPEKCRGMFCMEN